jgi:glycosyltransferase involved in cell wall biosynthesis
MNILIINSAKEWGGTEKWALYTACGLAEKGHTVYFGCRGNLFDKRIFNKNVKIVKFPFSNNIDLITLWKLRSFMIKNRIDAVMPSKQREYFLAGLAAKLFTKAKVAGMFGIDRPIHNLRNHLVFCRLFDIVFVVAKKIIDVLAQTKEFDTNKCRVVYVGVQPIERSEETRKKMRDSLGISGNETCIMGIGRLSAQKGFDYAIKAVSLLSQTMPHVKLALAGEGDREFYSEIAVKENVKDKVIFTGFRDDIPDLIQAADIFWLTSRSEGIPNVMLEAMATHIPVVSFDIAGVAEILKNGQNGILVPFEDINALGNETLKLINDKKLSQSLGENGYTTVTNDFSMEKMSSDTERHLKELITKDSRKTR